MTEKNILIDTSCLIAYFNKEPEYEKIKIYLLGSHSLNISTITFVELLSVIGKIDLNKAYQIVEYLENSPIKTIDVDKNIAKVAGALRLKYKNLDFSTADCIILASGIKNKVDKVLTKDHIWENVKEINVEVV